MKKFLHSIGDFFSIVFLLFGMLLAFPVGAYLISLMTGVFPFSESSRLSADSTAESMVKMLNTGELAPYISSESQQDSNNSVAHFISQNKAPGHCLYELAANSGSEAILPWEYPQPHIGNHFTDEKVRVRAYLRCLNTTPEKELSFTVLGSSTRMPKEYVIKDVHTSPLDS